VWSADQNARVPDFLGDGAELDSQNDAPHFEFAAEAEINIDRVLGGGLGQHVRREALARGVDGLAWYVSFHGRGLQWGIYIPTTSIIGVAAEVFGATALDLPAKMRLAAHVMHQHELLHFAVDYMTGLWELTHRRPVWKPGRQLRGAAGYYELEEQLANAHMLRRINAVAKGLKVAGRAAALRRFISNQPAGYRDAPAVVSSDRFRRACVQLLADYVRVSTGGEPDMIVPVLTELLLVDRRLDWRNCPVHIVRDQDRFSLPDLAASLFSSVYGIYEPEDFVHQLNRCDRNVRKAWLKTKSMLAQTVRLRGLDFKPWPGRGNEFSVRVNDNFRAHLLFHRDTNTWTALKIGSHAAMGHG
jgi:hypothetical protein